MKPATRSKSAKLACAVCFLGIGLLAIPVRSQTRAYVTRVLGAESTYHQFYAKQLGLD